jgi:hypothetical protein
VPPGRSLVRGRGVNDRAGGASPLLLTSVRKDTLTSFALLTDFLDDHLLEIGQTAIWQK